MKDNVTAIDNLHLPIHRKRKIEYSVNLPNILTLLRLLIFPFIIPFLIVAYIPESSSMLNFVIAVFYALISLTDFFDGYCARKFDQVTRLGALLDPLADKIILLSTFLAFVAIGRVHFFWALLLLGREFFITGIRLVAAEYSFTIPVFWIGKLKTVVQNFFIIYLILFSKTNFWNICTEYFLLSLVLFLSLGSAYHYVMTFFHILKQES